MRRRPPLLPSPTVSRRGRGRGQAGFALLAALWLIVTLSALVGLGLATTRLGLDTTANRGRLAQGRWAAEGCLAIAQGRWAAGAGQAVADSATIDLGQDKRCAWHLTDLGARLNVNLADRHVLVGALTALGVRPAEADSLGRVIVARRGLAPLDHLEQLGVRAGLADTMALVLSTDGTGKVNLNTAPAPVLGALPGMTPEAVHRVLYTRSLGRAVTSVEALAGALSSPARAALLARYADLARLAVVQPPLFQLTATGWTGARDGLTAEIELLVVPLPARLAVVRRRMRT